jgi:hypothetical protein
MATPRDETADGFAATRDLRVDEASGDQFSENVIGISRERLTFENFATKIQGESKNMHD